MMYREKISCFVIDRITDWFIIIPACQAYDLVIVLGAWILHVCLICYLAGFCRCVLMILILVMLMGMPGIWGVGWQVNVRLFFSGNQGISCILLEHTNKKNHLLKASDESSVRGKLTGFFWLFVLLCWIGCSCRSGLVATVVLDWLLVS